MAENFNLIFGSQAPTTATWSDADYQTGWSTVGSTPPTAEQFDFLQNRADMKAKELNDTLTPLVQKSEADGRQAGTIYAAGACVTVDGLPNGWLLECVVPGTSGTVAITLPDPLIDGATIIDGSVTWKLRKVATNGSLGYRQPNTAYTAGQIAYHSALPTGYYLECTTAGTTSAGDITPSSTIGDTVTDGTVVWTINNAINPVLRASTGDNLITTNADLNDYKTYGVYMCPSASVAESLSNCPVSFNFKLVVVNNGGANASYPGYQFIIAGGTNAVLYFRNRSSGSWGAWQQQEAIVAKSLGQNGYIKYASGLIIQWGTKTPTLANTVIDVDFPVSFSAHYAVTGHAQSLNLSNYVACLKHSLSMFKILVPTSLPDFMWIAIGY